MTSSMTGIFSLIEAWLLADSSTAPCNSMLIAGGQGIAQRLQLGEHGIGNVGRLHAVGHHAADGNGRQPVAPPLDAGLEDRR